MRPARCRGRPSGWRERRLWGQAGGDARPTKRWDLPVGMMVSSRLGGAGDNVQQGEIRRVNEGLRRHYGGRGKEGTGAVSDCFSERFHA